MYLVCGEIWVREFSAQKSRGYIEIWAGKAKGGAISPA